VHSSVQQVRDVVFHGQVALIFRTRRRARETSRAGRSERRVCGQHEPVPGRWAGPAAGPDAKVGGQYPSHVDIPGLWGQAQSHCLIGSMSPPEVTLWEPTTPAALMRSTRCWEARKRRTGAGTSCGVATGSSPPDRALGETELNDRLDRWISAKADRHEPGHRRPVCDSRSWPFGAIMGV